MVTIVTRSGKGTPLTHQEIDDNFNNLNTQKFEADPPVTAGTNTITASYDPTEGAYVTDLIYALRILNANTGAVTLDIDSVAATAVQTVVGNALIGGELQPGMIAYFMYNGTNFRLLNPHFSPEYVLTDHETSHAYYWAIDVGTDDLNDLISTDNGSWISTSSWSALTGLNGGSGVKSVIINVSMDMDPSSTECQGAFHVRPEGNTWTRGNQTEIFHWKTSGISNTSQFHLEQVEVPCNPDNNEFEFSFEFDNGTTIDLAYFIYLKAYSILS